MNLSLMGMFFPSPPQLQPSTSTVRGNMSEQCLLVNSTLEILLLGGRPLEEEAHRHAEIHKKVEIKDSLPSPE
jgi:hypothetical protein